MAAAPTERDWIRWKRRASASLRSAQAAVSSAHTSKRRKRQMLAKACVQGGLMNPGDIFRGEIRSRYWLRTNIC